MTQPAIPNPLGAPALGAPALVSSNTLFNALENRLKSLESTRVQIEILYTSNTITEEMLDNAYIGLFLSMCTEFEGFLEDLFLGLLLDGGGVSQSDVTTNIVVSRLDIMRALIYGIKGNYADWLPYERTVERAETYFLDGKPFSKPDQGQRSRLKEIYLIRNVLAHKSDFSRKKFDEVVVGNRNLSLKEKTPVGFLRVTTASGPMYRDHHLQLLSIARALTT